MYFACHYRLSGILTRQEIRKKLSADGKKGQKQISFLFLLYYSKWRIYFCQSYVAIIYYVQSVTQTEHEKKKKQKKWGKYHNQEHNFALSANIN